MKIDELIEWLESAAALYGRTGDSIEAKYMAKAAETIRLLWEIAQENSLAKYKRQIDEWSGNNDTTNSD